MSYLEWSANKGLHYLNSEEIRERGRKYVRRAERLDDGDPQKMRLLAKARKMFKHANS